MFDSLVPVNIHLIIIQHNSGYLTWWFSDNFIVQLQKGESNIMPWLILQKFNLNLCYRTVTCSFQLHRPHCKLGQHCAVRLFIWTNCNTRWQACCYWTCFHNTPPNHPFLINPTTAYQYYICTIFTAAIISFFVCFERDDVRA